MQYANMYLFLVWNKESKNSITFTHFGQPFDFIAENVIKTRLCRVKVTRHEKLCLQTFMQLNTWIKDWSVAMYSLFFVTYFKSNKCLLKSYAYKDLNHRNSCVTIVQKTYIKLFCSSWDVSKKSTPHTLF